MYDGDTSELRLDLLPIKTIRDLTEAIKNHTKEIQRHNDILLYVEHNKIRTDPVYARLVQPFSEQTTTVTRNLDE